MVATYVARARASSSQNRTSVSRDIVVAMSVRGDVGTTDASRAAPA
jgi:hypothetical protein